VALTKGEKYVVVKLLDAVTHGTTQAEQVALRADVLEVLGLTEDAAAELVSQDARSQHTEHVEPAAAEPDAEPDAGAGND
jgi:hypothetical protein